MEQITNNQFWLHPQGIIGLDAMRQLRWISIVLHPLSEDLADQLKLESIIIQPSSKVPKLGIPELMDSWLHPKYSPGCTFTAITDPKDDPIDASAPPLMHGEGVVELHVEHQATALSDSQFPRVPGVTVETMYSVLSNIYTYGTCEGRARYITRRLVVTCLFS